jgi:hypothetical protein
LPKLYRTVRTEVKEKIISIKEKYPHFDPHLAMIQVGGREDSSIYVKMKDKAAKEVFSRDKKKTSECVRLLIIVIDWYFYHYGKVTRDYFSKRAFEKSKATQ